MMWRIFMVWWLVPALAFGAASQTYIPSEAVKTVSGGTYTLLPADRAKAVLFTNATAVLTLPTTVAAALPLNWFAEVMNNGTGSLTLTATSPAIINSVTSLSLRPSESCKIVVQAINTYIALCGRTAGAAAPALAVSMTVGCAPNCPLNGTTTPVNVTIVSGAATKMEFSTDGFPTPWATCYLAGSGTSDIPCFASPPWGVTWCITSSCWGGVSGAHFLTVKATDSVTGQIAFATVNMLVADVGPPPVVLKTDMGVYPLPALPTIGGFGTKVVDPTFGTTIMRVTDATHPAVNDYCKATYSYWPVINYNSTKIKIYCVVGGTANMWFMDLDATAFTISNIVHYTGALDVNDATWSATDANKLFAIDHNNNILYSINATTGVETLVKNFSASGDIPAGQHILQMSKSNNSDDFFAFSRTNSSFAEIGYLAYKVSTNTVLTNVLNSDTNEVALSKTGTYLVVQANSGNSFTVNLNTLSIAMTSWAGDTGFFHNAPQTTGFVTGADPSALSFRLFTTPTVQTDTMIAGSLVGGCPQYSALADNDNWVHVSNCSQVNGSGTPQPGDTNSYALQNELYQINTVSPSCAVPIVAGCVRRIAHHRILWAAYEDQPNAAISKDGQFVGFTSNWDNSLGGRRELFIVKLPAAP